MDESSGSGDRRTVTPYSRDRDVSISPGEYAECHLCGERRHCVTRYEMLACRTCEDRLLPSSGLL